MREVGYVMTTSREFVRSRGRGTGHRIGRANEGANEEDGSRRVK